MHGEWRITTALYCCSVLGLVSHLGLTLHSTRIEMFWSLSSPKYFGDVYIPVHTVAARFRLQSADHADLVIPRVRSTRFGCRSFLVCGPTIWNKLPQGLRSTDTGKQFKRSLKHWLFNYAYIRWRI